MDQVWFNNCVHLQKGVERKEELKYQSQMKKKHKETGQVISVVELDNEVSGFPGLLHKHMAQHRGTERTTSLLECRTQTGTNYARVNQCTLSPVRGSY